MKEQIERLSKLKQLALELYQKYYSNAYSYHDSRFEDALRNICNYLSNVPTNLEITKQKSELDSVVDYVILTFAKFSHKGTVNLNWSDIDKKDQESLETLLTEIYEQKESKQSLKSFLHAQEEADSPIGRSTHQEQKAPGSYIYI